MIFIIEPILPAGSMADYVKDTNAASLSLPEFITSLVPSNILEPFTSGNSLQLLLLAIIIGLAVGMLRHKQAFIGKFIDGINSIFIEVLNIIFVFSPYALFFSVLAIILGGEAYDLDVLTAIFISILIGLAILLIIRCGILVFNGVNLI